MSESPSDKAEILCQSVFESIDEPIRVLESDLKIVLANRSASACEGVPVAKLVGRNCQGELPGRNYRCEKCLVKETFEDGRPHREEVAGIDANGDRWVTEIQTKPLFGNDGRVSKVIEIFRDRSREKRLERQLLHSAKLVSIGELSTSVAHEIRNPLGGIRLGLDALEPALAADDEASGILEDITKDIARLDRVVSELLNFARPQPHQPEWFELRDTFNRACRFIGATAKKDSIHLRIHITPPDLKVCADPNQIHQVLLNLMLNAVQAMPAGGVLTLEGRKDSNVNWSADRPEKGGFRIIVRDIGIGIPDEHMPRLFDPFFTTKPHGTGLGLTTSFAIVRKHNGELRINSKEGMGTTAQILLPEAFENGE